MEAIIQMPRGVSEDMMMTLLYMLRDEGFRDETTYWKYKKFKVSWRDVKEEDEVKEEN
jgi:hypothetical protein